MNDRIDELLWQAGGFNRISNPNDSYLDGKYILSQEQLDMFAELIIKECAQIGELKEQGYKDYNTEISVGFYIKQHFGVENE